MPLVYSPELGRIIEVTEFAVKTAPPVPYIGAVVHYCEMNGSDPQCLAAIITRIHYEDVVRLSIFSDDSATLKIESKVRHAQNSTSIFMWHWPHLPEVTP